MTIMDESGDYKETDPIGLAGNSVYRLYNLEDTEIARISFVDKGKVEINNKVYMLKTDVEEILKPFFREFNNEKNIIIE